jgi:KipI family sensor histidine kinase inhibitor
MTDYPRFLPAGDAALLVEFANEISEPVNRQVQALAHTLAQARLPSLGEAVPAYRSLLVHYDPLQLSFTDAQEQVAAVAARSEATPLPEPVLKEIPVVYGGEFGPDVEFVARHNGLSVEQVIRRHAGTTYRVYMLGFSPGFAYLGGLPAALVTPRLPTPRTRVPAGSVGIAGQQTGIYPLATPGGWRLIGRTPRRLFNPAQDPPTLLQAGDLVRFVAIPAWPAEGEGAEVQGSKGAEEQRSGGAEEQGSGGAEVQRSETGPCLTVLDGGLLTTVQDLGRWGYQRLGVPVAGAMDALALQAANRLVGNEPGEAALEITVAGPTLRASDNCLVAVTGGDLGPRVNGRPLPMWLANFVRRGSVLDFAGRRLGARAYLAVAGGIAVPPVLGSRSTCLSGGFGGYQGRALRAGDVLPIGRAPADLLALAGQGLPPESWPVYAEAPTVHVIPGPQDDYFTAEALATFFTSEYVVSATADRMGYRLQGPRLAHCGSAEFISAGVVTGSVQVPADGQPIVLMADHQTIGGYPVIATVVSADIPLLAQCLPGSRLRFAPTTIEEAQRRWRGVRRHCEEL